jgi:hypothetical protein
MSDALICTACATPHPPSERFCPDCGLPLVHSPEVAAAAPAPTSAQERARKIQARYAEGPLVRVAAARHQSEAELIQGMLLEEGIPSVQRRMRGFDVPDFLAAGPRDILVPEAGAEAAQELLADVRSGEPEAAAQADGERPLRLATGLLIAFVGAGALIWVLYQLSS